MMCYNASRSSWLRRLSGLTVAEVGGAGEFGCYLHKFSLTTSPAPCYLCNREGRTELRFPPKEYAVTTVPSPGARDATCRTLVDRTPRDGQVRKLTYRASVWGVSGWPKPGPNRNGETDRCSVNPAGLVQVRASNAGRIILWVEYHEGCCGYLNRSVLSRRIRWRVAPRTSTTGARGPSCAWATDPSAYQGDRKMKEETERTWKQEEKLEDQEILSRLRQELERKPTKEVK